MQNVPIIYRDFWDVPRNFIFRIGSNSYYFLCRFDEDKDDYNDTYDVFLIPNIPDKELKNSWERLEDKALKHLGYVLVKEVGFNNFPGRWYFGEFFKTWFVRLDVLDKVATK